jgi:DNA-binding MarR family transcriptional regulator
VLYGSLISFSEDPPMTLNLKTVPPVAGESPMRVRDILRRSYGAFRQDWLTNVLQYSPKRASEVAEGLEKAGFVVRDHSREDRKSVVPRYKLTDLGWAIVRASASRRIARTTAQVELANFMERVNVVNADQRFLYRVRSVAVFGSYLGTHDDLGDIDVAVDLEPKDPFDKERKWVEVFRMHAWESGRSFSSFEAEITWPRREVLLKLKSRKRSISIQSWYSFVEMCRSEDFRFEILLGDASEIKRAVEQARLEEKEASKGSEQNLSRNTSPNDA